MSALTSRTFQRLVNPYVQPVLYIRRPGSDSEEVHRFPDDDPFFSEVSVLVDNVEDIEDQSESILCTFEGAYNPVSDLVVVLGSYTTRCL